MIGSGIFKLTFEKRGGKVTDTAKAGTSIRIRGRDLSGYPHPKVLFYGRKGHTYAEVIEADPRNIIFKVPKLNNPGWYKVKIQTRIGWSDEHYFFCC